MAADVCGINAKKAFYPKYRGVFGCFRVRTADGRKKKARGKEKRNIIKLTRIYCH